MACTTILVGKKASYDGSTMIARNDDSPSGRFTPKKYVVVHPDEQPRKYISVLSHVEIDLPDNPMRYTAVPNALEGDGIWAASGVNEANVAMTATETITSNPRVLGADPLVVYQPASDGQEEVKGGIGEEDIVCLVLPYIRSAREGVKRLGSLLEQYGTYEMNGIAFQDADQNAMVKDFFFFIPCLGIQYTDRLAKKMRQFLLDIFCLAFKESSIDLLRGCSVICNDTVKPFPDLKHKDFPHFFIRDDQPVDTIHLTAFPGQITSCKQNTPHIVNRIINLIIGQIHSNPLLDCIPGN